MAHEPSDPEAAPSDPLARLREVKAKYEASLLSKPNVVAVGIGMPLCEGQPVGPPGIIVSVTHKVDAQDLAEEELVPKSLEEIPVWVEEIDRPSASSGPDPEKT